MKGSPKAAMIQGVQAGPKNRRRDRGTAESRLRGRGQIWEVVLAVGPHGAQNLFWEL